MRDHDLDPTYLVPQDAETVADAFANAQDGVSAYEIDRNADGLPMVRDGDMIVAEVIAEVTGGCVVRIAPMMGDAHELASFVADRDHAMTLVACEEAAGRAQDMVETYGGIAAGRSRGRWRAIDDTERAAWSAHAIRVNIQNMRAGAGMAKAA